MSNTLTYSDVIRRTGHTIIDGVNVVEYVCQIPIDKPQDMRLTSARLKPDLYREHRDICRADLAAFEDAAYELQEEYLAKANA